MNAPPETPRYLRLPALLLMAVGAGLLLCLAFPPFELGPIAWVALVPLFFALSQTRSVAQGAACGLMFGLVFFGPYLHFILVFGVLPWIAATVYQAAYGALFGAAAGPVMRLGSPGWRVLGGAGAWTLVTYLRSNAGPIAFSGGDPAFTQYDQLPLLQIASVFGGLGLSFAIAAVNAALSQALLSVLPMELWRPNTDLRRWQRRAAWAAVICYLLLFLAYFLGALALRSQREDTARYMEVALVQGDVPLDTPVSDDNVQQAKEVYPHLHRQVLPHTDLTIWPETALPGYLDDPELTAIVEQAAAHTSGHFMIGVLEDIDGKRYNSALLYDSAGRIVDRYHKMDLVIYSEYVPLREQMPFLERYPIRKYDISPGPARKLFDVNGVKVAPLICFESMFSRPTREVCQMGAEVVAILTNDAWAEGSFEAQQHSRIAAVRAVEARRYLLRSATVGQSAVYSPWGELLAEVPVGVRGVIHQTVYPRADLSIYHRLGDSPLVVFCLIAYCLAFVLGPDRAPQGGPRCEPQAT